MIRSATMTITVAMSEPTSMVAWLYLRAALQHQLAKIRDKQYLAQLPLEQRQKEAERLRDLAKRVKYFHQDGRVWWWLVVLCVLAYCSIFLALVLRPVTGSTYIYAAPTDKWRVIAEPPASERQAAYAGGWEFMMQRVHNGVPLPAQFMRFCLDYRPRFQIGYTLTYLAFDDHGSCVSIKAKDRWYQIERGPDKGGRPGQWPTIPDNCTNLGMGRPVVCDGPPRWKED